jgi:hypothetical protein
MIMDAAGKSDEEQLRAIASSPWLTGQPVFTQSYYDNLHQIWGEITVQGGRNS